jgi:hypothetical protein
VKKLRGEEPKSGYGGITERDYFLEGVKGREEKKGGK